MMYRGLVVTIEFKTPVVETRFRKWIERGNKRIPELGLESLGLQGHLVNLSGNLHLYCLEHSFWFNFKIALRFMLFLVTWNIRKDIVISSISKVELYGWLKGLKK